MNPPEFPAGVSPPSKKELQLQGPRPSPLKVSNESHKIKKQPLPQPAPHRYDQVPPGNQQQQRVPRVIYTHSPKVIHVARSDFMDVVQRLTGAPSGGQQHAGDMSQAAMIASIKNTSPSEKERKRALQSGNDDMMLMMGAGVEVRQFPSLLSPEPASLPPLPPLPPHAFWPESDPQTASYLNEVWSTSNFLASPSSFLPGVSPQPSPNLFSLFDS